MVLVALVAFIAFVAFIALFISALDYSFFFNDLAISSTYLTYFFFRGRRGLRRGGEGGGIVIGRGWLARSSERVVVGILGF